MKVIVTHEPTSEEEQVSIVSEGNEVLTRCGNRSRACMLLMGLIYALNLEYPKRNAFEAFQKLFPELDGAKLPKIKLLDTRPRPRPRTHTESLTHSLTFF